MTGDIYWYIVMISAYYSLIIGPIGKDYLFSSIQYGSGYVGFVVIIIEVTISFNVLVRIKIYYTGTNSSSKSTHSQFSCSCLVPGGIWLCIFHHLMLYMVFLF